MKPVEFVKNWWKDASSVSRALVATGALSLVGALGYAITAGAEADYAPLYSGLHDEDAGEIIERLTSQKIPYKLNEGPRGTQVLVPKDQRSQLRLTMAKEGLPGGGHEGFSLFDDNSVLMTDFTQKVNLQRALQGELARTISAFPQVDTARVHIATPERSIFSAHQEAPSASVVVHLRRGKKLSEEQIATINHLVASAVENLAPERVTITDQRMRLLSNAGDPASKSAKLLSLVHDQEKRIEGRVVNLLEPAVGMGRVLARVSLDMDLSKVKEKKEEFDADNATLKTERKFSENAREQNTKNEAAAGVAGNIPQRQAPQEKTAIEKNSGRDETVKEYAIPNVIRHTERSMGKIKRLSVAVLIDSSAFEPSAPVVPADPADPKDKTIKVPDSAETKRLLPKPDLARLAELVKTAVGFDQKRGDQIEVLFVPFNQKELAMTTGALGADPAPPNEPSIPTWIPVTVVCVLGFLGLGTAMFMTERKRRKAEQEEAARRAEMEAKAADVQTIAEHQMENLESELDDLTPSERHDRLREEVIRLASDRRDITFNLFKDWLEEGMPNKGET